MSTAERFKRYEQNQGQLFPAHLSDGLDPSDPVFFIDDVVERLEAEIAETLRRMDEVDQAEDEEHGEDGLIVAA